jgi:hypothetical protein
MSKSTYDGNRGLLERGLVYRIDPDAIVIVEVFDKSSRRTPLEIVDLCRRRLRA